MERESKKEEKKEKKEQKLKKLPMVEANIAQFKKMSDERRRMRRLRHDLERVRLLCELIRKREQRKRELLSVSAEITTIQLNPFLLFLRKLLEHLEVLDTQDIFADPVDPDEVPLIRRLQFAKASKEQIGKLETPQKNSHHSLKSPKSVGLPSDESSQGEEDEEEEKEEMESKKEEKKEKKEQKLKKLPMV